MPREAQDPHLAVRGLSIAAMVLVGLSVGCRVLRAVSDWRNYLVVRDYVVGTATDADLDAADSFARQLSIPTVVVLIAAAVVFLVWLWRARCNSEQIGGFDTQRHSSGWVVGSWICPIVNLWFPYQVVVDVWQASAPRRGTSNGLVLGWWLLYLGSTLTDNVLLRLYLRRLATQSSLLTTANVSTVSTACELAAGVLIALIITRITAWQSQPR